MISAYPASDVYPLGTLLSLRAGNANSKSDPLIKLMKVPAEVWQRYDPKVIQGRSRPRNPSKDKREKTAEVTEVLPIDGEALWQWMRKALHWKKRELEETTGAELSERKGVKDRWYFVISGSHLAVGKALPALESLLEEGRSATAKDSPGSVSSGATAGQAILRMVKTEDVPSVTSHSEPETLSTDEFLLGAMEAREDAEIGADASNAETFGEIGGWSHEENLAASNALLKRQKILHFEDTAGCDMEFQADSAKASTDFQNVQQLGVDPKPSASEQQRSPSTMTPGLVHRPPPPPVPAWARPPSTQTAQDEKPPMSKACRAGKPVKPPPSQQPMQFESTPSPKVTVQNSTLHEEWSCSACTLLNPNARRVCGACEAPRYAAKATPPVPTYAAASKKKPLVAKSSKAFKSVEPADPLPQRKTGPRPPPRILTAGLVVNSSSANAASGPRWAERPVERLNIGSRSCAWEAEEEDPDLACYIWNRNSNRPKIEKCQRVGSKWGIA